MMNYPIKHRITSLIAPLLGLALLAGAWSARADTEILDRIVAIVDDDVILASEMEQRYQQAVMNIREADQPMPEQQQLRREVLERLIIESIQLQMAERAGVRITDEQLNDAIQRIAAQNNMDLDTFRRAVESEGMSYAQMREQIRQDLLLQRVQAGNVNQRVQITDQEIDNFLASEEGRELTAPQYHFAHLLVPLSSDAAPADERAAREFAAELATRLREGNMEPPPEGPFAVETGDLGWRKPDEIPSLFTDIAPDMAVGEVSDPVRSPSGFHVIKLLEARGHSEIIPQIRARHILLKPSAIRSEEQTEALAAELRQRVLDGEDFAELAREYSEDIGSAMEGGDLGWTSPGQMVPKFQQVMENTPKGEISEPFRSRFGWHILRVEDHRQKDVTEDMRRNMARNYIHQRKFDEELEVWQQKIRDEAYVDIKHR